MVLKKWKELLMVGFLIILISAPVADAKNEKPKGYPERNIEVIVGWGAGGGTDTYMRTISIRARKLLRTPLVIVNMPGASGAMAAEHVQQQPADGYTLWACGSNFPINSAIGKTKYSVDDFEPIIRNQWDLAMIQVNGKDGRFKNIKEMVAFAKKNPGKVTIGGTGAASFDEIVLSILAEKAGIKLNYIPYEKASKMHSAVLGGHLDAMFEEPGPTLDLIATGALKPILAFIDERVEEFSNVPTAKEMGWDINFGVWRGLLAKKGTPPEIVKYLHDMFKKASEHQIYKAIEKQRLLHIRPGYMGSAEFTKLLKNEVEIYRETLKKLGHIN